MRHIGNIADKEHASRFTAYMVTQGIAVQSEQEDLGQWAIWVRDENHVEQARKHLEQFRESPDAKQYDGVERQANEILRDELKRRREARKNYVQVRQNWGTMAAGRRPLTIVMIGLSVLVFLLTDRQLSPLINAVNSPPQAAAPPAGRLRVLLFVDPLPNPPRTVAETLRDVRSGQVWRLITPIFLHFGVVHLAFNMLWLYMLGGQIEGRQGTVRLALIVLACAVLSNLVQCLLPRDFGSSIGAWLGGSWLSGGMSGVVYGLFGYVWMKMIHDPAAGLGIDRGSIYLLMGWFLLGFLGILESVFGMNVGNWSHGIGLLVGCFLGYLPARHKRRK